MDKSKYYSVTNIPKPNIDWYSVWGDELPTDWTKKRRWKIIRNGLDNIWPKEIHDMFSSIDLKIEGIRVFNWHTIPFFSWHTDGSVENPVYCAMNWVVSGGGVIQWNDDMKLNDDPYQLAKAVYWGNENDSYTCQTLESETQYIVNTGIPHRVVNINSTVPRISLSVKFMDKEKWTYENVYNEFNKLGLLQTT